MESTKVITGKVRFSFVNVFSPEKNDDGSEGKYSVKLLVPKSDIKTCNAIKAAIEAARLNSADKFGGNVPVNLKNTVHDGDGEKPNGGEYGPECKGCLVIKASSSQKPGVVDRDKLEILDPNDFYSGCYGRASINFYAYNTSGNKGISCGLNNVQKLADGPALGGGRARAEDDFDDDFDDDDI